MIRSYKKGDEQQINALFHEVFRKQRSLMHWEWKFKENPLKSSVITVAEENNEIAGHVALVPANAKWYDREVTFGARNDTMVSPRHQGKGLYKKLNLEMISTAEEEGMDYLYGYPAEKAKELFVRYTGAKEIASIPRLIRINRLSSLVVNKLPVLKAVKPLVKIADLFLQNKTRIDSQKYIFKTISECGREFDALWESSKGVAPILLKRDAQFLNWRFHRHPDRDYQMVAMYEKDTLCGYSVISMEEKTFGGGTVRNGTIVDMLAIENEEVWEQLLAGTLKELEDADVIQTWALTHSAYFQTLRKFRFAHKDNPMPLVGKPVDPLLTEDDGIENWYITPADVDSF